MTKTTIDIDEELLKKFSNEAQKLLTTKRTKLY